MEQTSLHDWLEATGGSVIQVPSSSVAAQNQAALRSRPFERVVTDSREVRPGDLFLALKGERFDGHDFLKQAVDRGAGGCLVHRDIDPTSLAADCPLIRVQNTRLALLDAARWYRSTLETLVVGVTGSVGKTTTRDLIHAALASEFDGVRSRKNFNNEIGLPLSLFDIERQHEFAVLEMGASRVGDVGRLAEVAAPEVSVVTAIGPAHLATFGSLENIIRAKGELLEALPPCGFCVLPGDDPILRQMADRAPCPVIFVGEGDDNHLMATRVQVSWEGLCFQVEGQDYEVPVHGRHQLTNALCAIAIAREIGVPPRSIAQGLSLFEPIPGRCKLGRVGPWTVIDDSYNASPTSVSAACELLHDLEAPGIGQRILVLGDMKELGHMTIREHERVGELVAQCRIDRLLACGSHADDLARGAERSGMPPHHIAAASDLETIQAVLDCWLEPDDILLVKGSRSTRMERVIAWLHEKAALVGLIRGKTDWRTVA